MRLCAKCKNVITEENSTKDGSSRDGFGTYCSCCYLAIRRDSRDNLGDNYLRTRIAQQYGLIHIQISEEMVELKRTQLIDKRRMKIIRRELSGAL